jgi:2-(1,2-epoxy-1,2-dihydrophenyl)acetyl-CoA isomerase
MTVDTEILESGIVVLRLNQPGGNKFTKGMLEELEGQLSKYSMNDTRGIILTGSGRAFSVGGDLTGMKEALDTNDPSGYVNQIVPLINKVILSVISHELPIVTALNGSAAGGGLSLALAGDYRISVPGAKLSMAFGKLGLSPDSGSSVLFRDRLGHLVSLCGISKGDIVLAEEATESGAVNQITESEELISEAEKFILDVTRESQWTFAKAKHLLNYNLVEDFKKLSQLEYELIKESSKRSEFQTKLNTLLSSLK